MSHRDDLPVIQAHSTGEGTAALIVDGVVVGYLTTSSEKPRRAE